jgi:hypothetical protein
MQIQKGRCTPILGSGLLEPLTGSTREIARRLAEENQFPMAPHARDDLPQVAQYLSVALDDFSLRQTLKDELRREILRRFPGPRPGEEDEVRLLSAAGASRRARDASEPHAVLARLPFPLYVTTNFDPLLGEALAEQGKRPRVELCHWNDEADWPPSVYELEPDYHPSVDDPLVFHLFGRLQEPESLVLTEDNYFDYLIKLTRNNEAIPRAVRLALTDRALLFLGFRMDEWDFRSLFRSIMDKVGPRHSRYAHVAVQIDPGEDRFVDAEAARGFLERYFRRANIEIYRVTVEDFARELWDRWTRAQRAAARAPETRA